MSHFLQRLAERSTERPAVRPRVAGRFERGPWADATVVGAAETDHGSVLASATPAQAPAATDLPEGTPVMAPVAAASASPAGAFGQDTEPPTLAVRIGRAAPSAPAASRGHATPLEPRPSPAATEAAPPPPPAASVTLSRRPPPPVRPVPVALPPAASRAAAPAVPDVVQVRIGRIEVRAVLGAPGPAARKSAEGSRPRPLALEAFLERRRRP